MWKSVALPYELLANVDPVEAEFDPQSVILDDAGAHCGHADFPEADVRYISLRRVAPLDRARLNVGETALNRGHRYSLEFIIQVVELRRAIEVRVTKIDEPDLGASFVVRVYYPSPQNSRVSLDSAERAVRQILDGSSLALVDVTRHHRQRQFLVYSLQFRRSYPQARGTVDAENLDRHSADQSVDVECLETIVTPRNPRCHDEAMIICYLFIFMIVN